MCVQSRCGKLTAHFVVGAAQVYGYIFSEDADVVTLVSKVMPLVASFQVGI